MFTAFNKNKEKIHISNATSGENYFCPTCDGRLIVKRGDTNAHHFAHKHKCTDAWHYDMTEWHSEWQNQFPLENQEKVFSLYGNTHRADVFINDTVLEFQHSPISESEFDDRNHFYNGLGFYVIWIFDVRDKEIEYLENSYDNTSRFFAWKHPIRFLSKCDKHKKGVTVFLQIDNPIWERQKDFKSIIDFKKLDIKANLIKIDELPDGFNQFVSKDYYSDVEILETLLKKNYENKEWYDYKLKPDYDAICDHIDNDSGINYDIYGYCPKYNKDIRYLDECHGCYDFIPKYNGCNFRFKETNKEKIKYIYSLERDKDGHLIGIDYLIDNERKKKKFPNLPSNERTLLYFVNANPKMRVARFKNTYTGDIVQLGQYNMKKLREEKKCYGTFCSYKGNKIGAEKEIYNWEKPSWIMLWRKNEDDPDREVNTIKSNIKPIKISDLRKENKKDNNYVPTVCPLCGGIICLIDDGKKVGCQNYPNCDYVIM